jgi:hypothetical protein
VVLACQEEEEEKMLRYQEEMLTRLMDLHEKQYY